MNESEVGEQSLIKSCCEVALILKSAPLHKFACPRYRCPVLVASLWLPVAYCRFLGTACCLETSGGCLISIYICQ